MELKNFDHGQRHDFINGLLREIYIDHELDRVQRQEVFSYSPDMRYFKIKNLTETVVYWLRKTIDDVIGITHYIAGVAMNNGTIEKLIASIGDYFKCQQEGREKEFVALMTKYDEFFRNILDASNSYKHSFIQYEANSVFNAAEPCIMVLYLKYNDLRKDPKYISLPLKQFVEQYSDFFNDMLRVNKTYSDKMLSDLKNQSDTNAS